MLIGYEVAHAHSRRASWVAGWGAGVQGAGVVRVGQEAVSRVVLGWAAGISRRNCTKQRLCGVNTNNAGHSLACSNHALANPLTRDVGLVKQSRQPYGTHGNSKQWALLAPSKLNQSRLWTVFRFRSTQRKTRLACRTRTFLSLRSLSTSRCAKLRESKRCPTSCVASRVPHRSSDHCQELRYMQGNVGGL
jgi:hypothetical protein